MKRAKNILDIEMTVKNANIVVASDVHIPFQDDKAVNSFLKYCKHKQPDIIVLNGDVMDFFRLSRFTKGEGRNPLQEITMCRKFLKSLREMCKSAQIYYVIGNHECFDGRTELLTGEGWVNIKDIVSNPLNYRPVCYDMDNKKLCAGSITGVIKKPVDYKLLQIETANTKQIVTPMHNVLTTKGLGIAASLKEDNLHKLLIPCATGNPFDASIYLTPKDIRLITLIVADGTITKKPLIQIKASKPEKLKYIEKVLEENSIKYTKKPATMSGVNKLQPYVYRVYGDDARRIIDNYFPDGVKDLPENFKSIDGELIDSFVEGLINTDGSSAEKRKYYYSKSKHDIDIVQQVLIMNGYSAKYKANKSGFKQNSFSYSLMFTKNYNWTKKQNKISEIDSSDGNVYCIQTDKGTVVSRIDGKVAITGNCRLERYVLEKAPELASLVEDVFTILKVKDFDIIGCASLLLNNQLVFKHGTLLGNKSGLSAIKEMENAYMSGCTGHCHKLAKYIARKAGKKFIWIESGCLCDLEPEYMVNPNWQQGFALFEIKNGKLKHSKIVEIEDGEILE